MTSFQTSRRTATDSTPTTAGIGRASTPGRYPVQPEWPSMQPGRHRTVMPRLPHIAPIALVILLGLSDSHTAQGADTYRGVKIAPENRCAPFDRKDYPYPQSVERAIVARLGGVIYSPYTGTCFRDTGETDIEHVVALSEAHDSGLCAAGSDVKARFSRDPLNLTLASPSINRHQKIGKDPAEWLPPVNACWFVGRTLEVRRKYALTIDRAEADAIELVLAACSTTEMIMDCENGMPRPRQTETANDALLMYDNNGNGRISCSEARHHGIVPVPRSHPAYPFMRDGDGDGVVCE